MTKPVKILIVDDSGYSRSIVRKTLEGEGYEVIGEAKDGAEALDKIEVLDPELITLDNILPDMTGIDILRAIRSQGIETKVIMISAVGQQSAIEEAQSLGVKAYLIKPFNPEVLIKTAKEVLMT